jgi:PIN domain nuclease of toxin-antitoxin system
VSLPTAGYLADACALVAFFAGAPGMSGEVLAAMGDGRVAVSSVTVWELTRKAALGKLPPLPSAGGSFGGWLHWQGFVPLPFAWADAEAANVLPPLHKDPMDRMLVAQAKRHGMTVITEDGLLAAYGVATAW